MIFNGRIIHAALLLPVLGINAQETGSQEDVGEQPAAVFPNIADLKDLPFTFNTTCDDSRQRAIALAWQDVQSQIKLVNEAPSSDNVENISYQGNDLFGPATIKKLGGETRMKTVFQEIANRRWKITANCDASPTIVTDNEMCKKAGAWGGIYGTSGSINYAGASQPVMNSRIRKRDDNPEISMTFCNDFFSMSNLENHVYQTRVSGELRPVYGMYNLDAYHRNQATTLLRQMIHHLPRLEHLEDKITDLNVKLPFVNDNQAQSLWYQCYGAMCARILARVSKSEKHWSSLNADTYALYALSYYLQSNPTGNVQPEAFVYPWLPPVVNAVPGNGTPVLTSSNQGTFVVGLKQFTEGILHPNKGALTDLNTTTSEVPLASLEGAQMTTYEEYPKEFNDRFQNEVTNIYKNKSAINKNKVVKFECASAGDKRFKLGDLVKFTRQEGSDSARQFCEKYNPDNQWFERHVILPYIQKWRNESSDDKDFVSSVDYLKSNQRDFFVYSALELDNLRFTDAYRPDAVGSVFEGSNLKELVGNCTRTLESIMDNCDKDSQDGTFGGSVKVGNIFFDLVATRRQEDIPPRDLGEFRCAEVGPETLHLALEYQQDPSKTCQCSYSIFPDSKTIFCRPEGGCQNIKADDDRLEIDAVAMSRKAQKCQ